MKLNNTIKHTLALIGIFFYFNSTGQINWTKPNANSYSFSASAICAIYIDEIHSNDPNDRIAFFVGSELRGLGTPINVGNGQYLHFVTFYSNIGQEMMDVKIYKDQSNLIMKVATPIEFHAQKIVGSISEPYIAYGYTDNDAPISISDLPAFTTLEDVPFDTIFLSEYLIQPDTNSVVWTYDPQPNLVVQVFGDTLLVAPISGYFGSTDLTIRATEVSQFQKFAEQVLTFNVIEAYDGPDYYGVINQGIVLGGTFVDLPLQDYENQYGGTCLNYEYEPVLTPFIANTAIPLWFFMNSGRTNMTLSFRSQFTSGHIFNHEDDRLAIFIDGELRGLSFPSLVGDIPLYFVTLGGDGPETQNIEIKFYSGTLKRIFTRMTNLKFVPHAIHGTPDNPVVLDFSPLDPLLTEEGVFEMNVRDSMWTGEMTFAIKTLDCTYPQFYNHESIVSYCITVDSSSLTPYYFDGNGDGRGDRDVVIYACTQPETGWVDNDDDCNDDNTLEININIIENSGTPNDGIVCSGTTTNISVPPFIILTNSGTYTQSINVNPTNTTTYYLTLFSTAACFFNVEVEIIVESTVVTSVLDSGLGTLRNVLECVEENGSVYFDQPVTNFNIINQPLTINKNVNIIGLSPNLRPYIGIDFQSNNPSIIVNSGKTLNLSNVNLHLINHSDNKPFFIGSGQVSISNNSNVVIVE